VQTKQFKDDLVVLQMVKEMVILSHLIRLHLQTSQRVAQQASEKFNDISTSPLTFTFTDLFYLYLQKFITIYKKKIAFYLLIEL
jgi:hypothetical protein